MRPTDMTRSPGSFATAANGDAPATRGASVGGRAFWTVVDLLFTVLERRKQRRALMALDEHLLKDIGVSRSEVEQEVTKPFWRG
ncbi:DUF1127 domain-containing protein [Azospirillum agricola]|uniref:DUF1127 domain-containing protein n=1 Tax=Azospirillum agricola TaxID=1720247 RepID=UPI000A0F3392|nr:DUF1127 domain-containing protein [Azospirillum agricola]SMH34054.1 protein of unknown function [Azospirillum lipoferum]